MQINKKKTKIKQQPNKTNDPRLALQDQQRPARIKKNTPPATFRTCNLLLDVNASRTMITWKRGWRLKQRPTENPRDHHQTIPPNNTKTIENRQQQMHPTTSSLFLEMRTNERANVHTHTHFTHLPHLLREIPWVDSTSHPRLLSPYSSRWILAVQFVNYANIFLHNGQKLFNFHCMMETWPPCSGWS